MRLSVIIVSYNVRHYLAQCLESVMRATQGISSEVIVYDNHSHDGSIDYVSKLFPKVRCIRGSHNLGFARANNAAIRRSTGEYVLLLNPDTFVGENVLRDALEFMDSHPEAGSAGVRMLSADGRKAMESRRGIPSPMTAFYKMAGLCSRFPTSKRFGKYYMGYLGWDEPQRIEIVSGAFCLLRRKAIDRVGMLDEDFFMYGEDIDLSYRILKDGFQNWYLPLDILHYKGESTQKSSFRYVHVFHKAMLIFIRKHYSHIGWLVTLPIQTAIVVKAFIELVKMHATAMHRSLGFFGKRNEPEQYFHFLVAETSLDSCRRLADNNGLDATFSVVASGNMESKTAELLGQSFNGGMHVVVFDTTVFPYGKMLELMSRQPHENVSIGTYSPERGVVLTMKEAFV